MTEQPHHDAPGDSGGPPPPPPPAAQPVPPDPVLAAGPIAYVDGGPAAFNRRAMLLSARLGAGLRRATWAGAIVGAVVAIAVALALGTAPALLVAIVAGVAGGGVGTLAGIVAMGGAQRRAFETFSWIGRREVDRFVERTGGPVPTNAADAARWVEAHPQGGPFALGRIEILASIGRLEEAWAGLADLPQPVTDFDAAEQAVLRRHVRYIATGVLDDAEVDAVLARLDPRGEVATEVRVGKAVGEARRRLDLGLDAWREPLLGVRPALDGAVAITIRDTWSKLATSLFLVSAAAGLVIAMAH